MAIPGLHQQFLFGDQRWNMHRHNMVDQSDDRDNAKNDEPKP